MKIKKYSNGGGIENLLPLLDLAAPGLGTATSTVVGLLEKANAFTKQSTPLKNPSNPFRTFKNGGKLKEYNLPTHEQGGGIIDKMGNPSKSGLAEIEKQEVVYTDKRGNNPYVFSDTLKDTDGKTFAMKAKEYQKFDKPGQIHQAAFKKLMSELQVKNDIAKQMSEQSSTTSVQKMPNGGVLGNDALTTLIDQNRVTAGYQDLLRNIRSGAFPRIGRSDSIPSGSNRILDNARVTGVQSPINTGLPTKPETPSTIKTTNTFGSLDLGKVGGILKGVALAGSAIDAFQKPEEEQLRVPDFSKGDANFTGLGGSFDPIRNDIIQSAKSGENQIMQSSGNFGQVMSRLNALQAGVGRNLANVGLQEKQYNDQIRMAKGQREDQKAGIVASEQIRKQTADSQNKAMRQDLVANLLQNINNYGTEFMKQDATMKQLKSLDKQRQREFLTQLGLLNITNPNFQINKDLINSDNPLSAIQFKQ